MSISHMSIPFGRLAACFLAVAVSVPLVHAPRAMAAGDTITTASGLKIIMLKRGTGRHPRVGEIAVVHYTGTLSDGTVFDDSRKRGEPLAFMLGKHQVIKGWDEGIALLRVGDRARLIIPPDLGYGSRGAAGGHIPPGATLIFDVELVDIARQTVGNELAAVMEKNGIDAARTRYDALKRSRFKGYYMSESDLNATGYRLLKEGKVAEAIEIFEINVGAFPRSANVYDSLGEGYMNAGDSTRAIANYERSLALDPDNQNAVEMLKKLKAR